MQPHYPYLFKRKKINFMALVKKNVPKTIYIKLKHNFLSKNSSFKKWCTSKNIVRIEQHYSYIYSRKEIIEAYERNLKNVKTDVLKLLTTISNKKIIITSDHAEYLGERGIYGHGGVKTELITTVPYVVIDKRWYNE